MQAWTLGSLLAGINYIKEYPMKNTINIAIALNNQVIIPAYVMIHSLVINNTENPLCLYVLHSELTEENMNLLKKAMQLDKNNNVIHFIKIDASKTIGLPYNEFWSLEMYYRLMLPEILGNDIERILYLDIDIIINKNIWNFYHLDFENHMLIATKDVEFDSIIALDQPESRKRNAFFLELKKQGMTYFCSGVLLMNLKRLKSKYTFQHYIDIFQTIKDKIILPDQDLLNYVHFKNVKLVDEIKYGLFTQTAHKNGLTYDYVKNNVSILHFTGQAKPWTVNLIRYDIEKIWWEYAKTTPFYYNILEQVFYNMLDSSFTENKFNELIDENNKLKSIINDCKNLINKLTAI